MPYHYVRAKCDAEDEVKILRLISLSRSRLKLKDVLNVRRFYCC